MSDPPRMRVKSECEPVAAEGLVSSVRRDHPPSLPRRRRLRGLRGVPPAGPGAVLALASRIVGFRLSGDSQYYWKREKNECQAHDWMKLRQLSRWIRIVGQRLTSEQRPDGED